jgi:hypothetical protein
MYQGRKDTGHPQRLLERLLGRRTDALTNFFTNLAYSSSERPGSFCATSRMESPPWHAAPARDEQMV